MSRLYSATLFLNGNIKLSGMDIGNAVIAMDGSEMMEAIEGRAEEVAHRLSLMANAKRLLILCTLGDKEMSVGALQASLGISQSSLSQHLSRLRQAEILSTRRDGQMIFYRINDMQTMSIMAALYETFCKPVEQTGIAEDAKT